MKHTRLAAGLLPDRKKVVTTLVNLLSAAALSALAAGDSYTLSWWSAANNAMGGGLAAVVRFSYTDGTTGVFTVPLTQGTHGWLQFTVVARAAQDYDSISVAVVSTLANGRVGIDDVILVEN